MISHEALTSSLSNEAYTPPDIVAAARATLGGVIDLDPASCALANEVVWARQFFTVERNALFAKWGDDRSARGSTVFLNPPGGTLDRKTWQPMPRNADGRQLAGGISSVVVWWWKLLQEYRAGRVSSAVFVVFRLDVLQNCQKANAREGFDFEPPHYYPFCIPEKRPKYWYADTPPEKRGLVGAPTHAAGVVYLPPRHKGGCRGGWSCDCHVGEIHVPRFAAAFTSIGLVRA